LEECDSGADTEIKVLKKDMKGKILNSG
jgi:hypothetical protein